MRQRKAPKSLARLTVRPLFAILAASLLTAACAHSKKGQTLVGEPIPADVREDIEDGRDRMVAALASFTIEIDTAVCESDEKIAETQRIQQAISEAYLELTRAIEKSRNQAVDDGDGAADREIVWLGMESPGEGTRRPAGWTCKNVAERKECVQATANSTAQLFYRSKIDAHSVEPEPLADLLDSVGADFEWAFDVVMTATEDDSPVAAIEKKCEAGESPLATFLNDQESRADAGLASVREAIVGPRDDLCSGLAATYGELLKRHRADLEQTFVSGQCRIRPWSPVD